MAAKTKLELTWIGKDNRPRLEPRILIEEPEFSHHASTRREGDIFDNMLIHGDNLLALKALETDPAVRGKVKCIYIDPPYNTPDMLNMEYDDGVEHSVWLTQMRDRFEYLHQLLSDDGVFFCQLNDDEMAYAKVLLDEVFGRSNFINQIAVRMKLLAGASGGGEDKRLKKNIEHILVYAKDSHRETGFRKFNEVYENVDLIEYIDTMEAAGKSWKYTSILVDKGQPVEKRTVLTGDGEDIEVTKYRGVQRTTVAALMRQGLSREEVYSKHLKGIFSDTNAQTSIRTRIIDEFQSLDDGELLEAKYVPKTGREKGQLATHYYIANSIRRVIWLGDIAEMHGGRAIKKERVGTFWEGFPLNNLTKEGGVQFPNGKKPEALIQRIFELATEPGDLVLDSFAGSGTTAAVAHKMGRRWITVELGNHAISHVVPRLNKVIDGEDTGGITRNLNWKGGGGYRFFRLAPSLLQKDVWGNWVISKDYNAEMLAEAMCKHFNYVYAPSTEAYWMHGQASENAFIYVTTASLTIEQLRAISDEVGEDRSLLICCMAYEAQGESLSNLTLKKIPRVVLDRCEWGQDDYSLKINALPMAEDEPDDIEDTPAPKKSAKAKAADTPDLFSAEEN